jgi:SRSO17 transposase
VRALVRLTHQRWAIEQQYQELKTELGLDRLDRLGARVHSTRPFFLAAKPRYMYA